MIVRKDKKGRAVASFGGGESFAERAAARERAHEAEQMLLRALRRKRPRRHYWSHEPTGAACVCLLCGLRAFPSGVHTDVVPPEGCDAMEYVAWERRGKREWEPVPSVCPLPKHLRPYRLRAPIAQAPIFDGPIFSERAITRRWSLWRVIVVPVAPAMARANAEAWAWRDFSVLGRALFGEASEVTNGPDSEEVAVIRYIRPPNAVVHVHAIFTKLARQRFAKLDAVCAKVAEGTLRVRMLPPEGPG